jgi:DNA mismatch repair ATPase MutL
VTDACADHRLGPSWSPFRSLLATQQAGTTTAAAAAADDSQPPPQGGSTEDPAAAAAAAATNSAATAELSRLFDKADFAVMQPLGQFNLGFIIARLRQDLFIIDQHAAGEVTQFRVLVI